MYLNYVDKFSELYHTYVLLYIMITIDLIPKSKKQLFLVVSKYKFCYGVGNSHFL